MASGDEVIRKAYAFQNYVEACGICSPSPKFRIRNMRAHDLTVEMKNKIFDLFTRLMKKLYQNTWGWVPETLWDDMFSDKSIFILMLTDDTETLAAYSHFQFSWDDEDVPEYPVLYCYEVMVDESQRRSGLGRFLMSSLVTIARHFDFEKTMLTCFKENTSALRFYDELGFVVDENSPSQHGMMNEDYEILSFFCQ